MPTGRVVIAAAPEGQHQEEDVPSLLESGRQGIAARLHDDSLQVMTAAGT